MVVASTACFSREGSEIILILNRFLSQENIAFNQTVSQYSNENKSKKKKHTLLVSSLLQEAINSSVTFFFPTQTVQLAESQNYREAKTLCRNWGKQNCPNGLYLSQTRNPSL